MTSSRLVEAFWHLVKSNRTERISVKMVVEEAHCSRGSFYYHFEDMNSMVTFIMENEMLLSGIIPKTIHAILVEDHDSLKVPTNDFHVKRVQLLASQSNPEDLIRASELANTAIWTHLLCQEGQELSKEAVFLTNFFTAGLKHSFGTQLLHPGAEGNDPLLESESLRETLITIVRLACKAQGITGNSFIKRLEQLKESGWVPADM